MPNIYATSTRRQDNLAALTDEIWAATLADEIAFEDSIEWMFVPVQNDEIDNAFLADEEIAPDAYTLGQIDSRRNVYCPPNCIADVARHEQYLRGWNDNWAAANNVRLSR